jgi:hypothetical protein
MEDARLVHSALSHQKMEVGVEIDPVPEGLDGGNDARSKRAPGHNLEASGKSLSKTRKTQARRQPALTIDQKEGKRRETINGSSDLLFNSRQGRGLFWAAVPPLFSLRSPQFHFS